MNLTDELQKLADLHQSGHLTAAEFSAAKRRLLDPDGAAAGPGGEKSLGDDETDVAVDPASGREERVYRSSRWSSGNKFFPDSLRLTRDGMLFRKGRLFGSDAEHIAYRAIASMKVKNGVFLSDLSFETTGGSQPIFLNGLWKSDAKEIQELVRSMSESVSERGPRA